MEQIAPIVTSVALVITAIGTYLNGRHIKEVKHEVKTGNSQTLAQLTDAVETRRIGEIPMGKRTELEKSHAAETPEVAE